MKGKASACKPFQFALLQDGAGHHVAIMGIAQFANIEGNLGFASLNPGYACYTHNEKIKQIPTLAALPHIRLQHEKVQDILQTMAPALQR